MASQRSDLGETPPKNSTPPLQPSTPTGTQHVSPSPATYSSPARHQSSSQLTNLRGNRVNPYISPAAFSTFGDTSPKTKNPTSPPLQPSTPAVSPPPHLPITTPSPSPSPGSWRTVPVRLPSFLYGRAPLPVPPQRSLPAYPRMRPSSSALSTPGVASGNYLGLHMGLSGGSGSSKKRFRSGISISSARRSVDIIADLDPKPHQDEGEEKVAEVMVTSDDDDDGAEKEAVAAEKNKGGGSDDDDEEEEEEDGKEAALVAAGSSTMRLSKKEKILDVGRLVIPDYWGVRDLDLHKEDLVDVKEFEKIWTKWEIEGEHARTTPHQ